VRHALILAVLLTPVAVLFAQDDSTPPRFRPIMSDSRAELEPGLSYRLYRIGRSMQRLHPLAPDQSPNVHRRTDGVDFTKEADFGGPRDHFLVEIDGFLLLKTAGRYGFRLRSDDGSRLEIGGTEVIDHDGKHGATHREVELELAAGRYPLSIRMFEDGGGAALQLFWKTPGAESFRLVPREALGTPAGVTRITSPGRKTLLDGREHLKPGDGLALDGVHPAWQLEDIRPESFEPQVGALAFLPDGRLLVATFKPVNDGVFRDRPNGTLWALPGALGDQAQAPVKIAEGFNDPSGLAVVEGRIYVAHREDITMLADRDGDGRFEHREVFVRDWIADNYHHFTFGLEHHDGWLYGSLSTSIYFGKTIENDGIQGEVVGLNGPNPAHRGTCFRVNLASRKIEYLAGGFRTPNGVLVRPDGEVFVADNQGAWLPASKLIHVKRGRFYGHRNGTPQQRGRRYPNGGIPSLNSHRPESPPAVWFPQNECANSPSESVWLRRGPYAGQILVGELTTGGIRRVALEEIDGELQGAVFRFTQGLECGVNRLIEGPDGCLYVGGTGAGGSWTWRNTQFGLQRLRPTTRSAFEMHRIRASAEGFEIFFTEPVPREQLEDPTNYQLRQWHYVSEPPYGGPKRDEIDLVVRRARAAGDGRSVRLEVPERISGSVVHLRSDVRSVAGAPLWSAEAWYTLNRIPRLQGPGRKERSRSRTRPLDGGLADLAPELRGHWFDAAALRLGGSRRQSFVPRPGLGTLWTAGEADTVALALPKPRDRRRIHLEFMLALGAKARIDLGRGQTLHLDPSVEPKAILQDATSLTSSPLTSSPFRRAGRWQSLDFIPHRDRRSAAQRLRHEIRINGVPLGTRVYAPDSWNIIAREGAVAIRNLNWD
jgi:glucose/arabinose dehydrogenase